ncbi:amidohydrolase family protein [Streptomyces sp. NPDC051896]|uniref:amidohydrolase family protein n=1 Tax=Streptomyces sp. NPDC051896 TaxID=3155416 RepID=UPI00341334CF
MQYAMNQLDSDGVTFETNTHGMYLGNPPLEPLLEELNRRGTPAFVHPTSPPNHQQVTLDRPRPMLEFTFDSARTVSDLVFSGHLAKSTGIPWVFTHGGGVLPSLADRMELFRSVFARDSDPTGTAPPIGPVPEQIGRLRFDIAGTPFPHQVPALIAAFGTDRVLYGSDYCFTPASEPRRRSPPSTTRRSRTATPGAHSPRATPAASIRV